MKIELLRGKKHGGMVLCVNDTRVSGMKDGFGYTLLKEFNVKDEEIEKLLKETV